MKVRKAVFPVAGLGTRMLPATKAVPKELLPVFDKPLIQYAFEEAVMAGCEEFIFVCGHQNRQALTQHFTGFHGLEEALAKKGKEKTYQETFGWMPEGCHLTFVHQKQPQGLGHAIGCAKEAVNGEPFMVILPDVLVEDTRLLQRMKTRYEQCAGNVLAVAPVPREKVERYGIVSVKHQHQDFFEIGSMVEKPSCNMAPSNLSILGRYILQPEIFDVLENTENGTGGEVQLTDAMLSLMQMQQSFYGVCYEGALYDCGSREGYMQASLAFAMRQPEMQRLLSDCVLSSLQNKRSVMETVPLTAA